MTIIIYFFSCLTYISRTIGEVGGLAMSAQHLTGPTHEHPSFPKDSLEQYKRKKMKKKLVFFEWLAVLALLASSCSPDLAIIQATANWDNVQQSGSFVLVNNGMKTTAPFEVQITLLDETDAVVEVAYTTIINGLGYGEKLEFKNLSLRHLLTPENQCLGQVTQAVFSIDPQNAIQEVDETNNRQAVEVTPIHVACDEMIRFEDLPAGIEFTPISHIASEGMGFAISALPMSGDYATVRSGLAVGNGQVLWLNNVWLQPKLSTPRHFIAFDAGYFGGDIYLEINGDTGASPYPDVAAIDGIVIGGVSVSVSGKPDNPGVWYFNGEIKSFKVGGQELAIDNLLFWTQKIKIVS